MPGRDTDAAEIAIPESAVFTGTSRETAERHTGGDQLSVHMRLPGNAPGGFSGTDGTAGVARPESGGGKARLSLTAHRAAAFRGCFFWVPCN